MISDGGDDPGAADRLGDGGRQLHQDVHDDIRDGEPTQPHLLHVGYMRQLITTYSRLRQDTCSSARARGIADLVCSLNKNAV